MLAKVWKKLLLAICVIAILFNITSKLVKRTNLGSQLKSVIGGTSLAEYFSKEDESIHNTNTIVDKTKNGQSSVKIKVK